MALRSFAAQAVSRLRCGCRSSNVAPGIAVSFLRHFSSAYPSDLKYAKSHEWVRAENTKATMGITDFALEQLGDVVYVELPSVGQEVAQGESVCTVESVKAASQVYAPISGKVVEVNTEITTKPETMKDDPYGTSWLVKFDISKPDELKSLLDADAYKTQVESDDHH